MNRFLYLLEEFEITKLSNECNFKDCKRPPSKEVIIKEFDVRRTSTRDVVSLYFCKEHGEKDIDHIIDKFNKLSTGKIIITTTKTIQGTVAQSGRAHG